MSGDVLADPARTAAYAGLLEKVFSFVPPRPVAPDPAWTVIAVFETSGLCVAGIEVGALDLVTDGTKSVAVAIRLAGVAPSHRSQGLFRTLMRHALDMCHRRDVAAPVLLYTEDEALYTRFGFVPLSQHAFVGASPAAASTKSARRVDRAEAEALIDRLAPIRTPVSRQCAVRGARDLLCANLDNDDLRFAFVEPWDALLIYERDADTLVIVDIVAEAIPSLASIVGVLASDAPRVRTLFPPDRLAWEGKPILDETGLMVRGALPPAMRRPFMLPPTTSF